MLWGWLKGDYLKAGTASELSWLVYIWIQGIHWCWSPTDTILEPRTPSQPTTPRATYMGRPFIQWPFWEFVGWKTLHRIPTPASNLLEWLAHNLDCTSDLLTELLWYVIATRWNDTLLFPCLPNSSYVGMSKKTCASLSSSHYLLGYPMLSGIS